MKALIIYYSYTGNTRKIAYMIRQSIGGEIAEIKTVEPYSDDYDTVVDQGQQEVKQGYMPKIKPIGANLDDYDTLILGTPVWWYTFAPAVKTFLHENDLNGKTVYSFITNGGWIGHTERDITNACKNVEVRKAINIKFDETNLSTSEAEIYEWIKKIEKDD